MSQINYQAINIGFGNLADEYDKLQQTNDAVKLMRNKFYETVTKTVPLLSYVLELNCGSGIDAHYFASKGYRVLATDISDKMLENAAAKGKKQNLEFRNLNNTELNKLKGKRFEAVISNLGGLNCIDDLTPLVSEIKSLVKPDGYFICTVMPRLSLWELALIFKGEFRRAVRRIRRKGTIANIGDEPVYVKYYSPSDLKKYLKDDFNLIYTRALRIFSPPPPADRWRFKHPFLTSLLEKLDNKVETFYPASFVCDNFISVFKKK